MLVIRQREAVRSEHVASAVIVIGAVVAGLLAFLVNQNLDRALNDRRQAIEDVETANERLQEQAVELEAQAEAAQTGGGRSRTAMEQPRFHWCGGGVGAACRASSGGDRGIRRRALDRRCRCAHHRPGSCGARRTVGRTRDARREGHVRFIAVHNMSAAAVGGTVDVNEARPICAAVRTGQPVILESLDAIRERFPGIESDVRRRPRARCRGATDRDRRPSHRRLTVRFTRPRVLSTVDRSFMTASRGSPVKRSSVRGSSRRNEPPAPRRKAANRAKAAFLAR